MARPFNATYSCRLMEIEDGGKVIMPPSALEQLTKLNVNYPMLFKITNKKTNCKTHCGVSEFVADEGKVYLPSWMMQNLVLEEGSLIQIENVSLPVGTSAKFQPVSSDFLKINNTKAVLENCLNTFACLTTGDLLAVTYNQKVYELKVIETKPDEAVRVVSCDMNLEFVTPVGYKRDGKDVVGDTSDVIGNVGLWNESNYGISNLQERLAEIREKYTVAIETMMHKRSKLELKELTRQCQNVIVTGDRSLTIPDFKVPTKVESECTDADIENFEKLKKRIKRQMGVMETLVKMKNCPIAQAMLEL